MEGLELIKQTWNHTGNQDQLHWDTIRTKCLWWVKPGYDLLTDIGLTETLCSFRLVLEGKADKEIPASARLGFLKDFRNNFALSDAVDNTSRFLNGRGIEDLPLLQILLATGQKSWGDRFLGNERLFYFITMSMFDSFKNLFAMLTSLPELHYAENFILQPAIPHAKNHTLIFYKIQKTSF